MAYLFTPGGAHKANRLILEGLAAQGNECAIISGGSQAGEMGQDEARQVLKTMQVPWQTSQQGTLYFNLNGVKVDVVTDSFRFFAVIKERVRDFDPDITVVSEDPSMLMVRTALEAGARQLVYLAHSQATLPFGPAAFKQDDQKANILRQVDGMITVSQFVADYIKTHGGLDATVIHSPVYGPPPHPFYGGFRKGSIAMVNPSGIKGLSLFLQMVKANPERPFAAVPTWATTRADRESLKLAGVEIIPASDNVDDVFARMNVLIVPSLWGEAFGQIVVEAMLRGIPVLASNLGGIPEAKLGVPYLLPVREIEAYENRHDECNVDIPIIPPQDCAPWNQALRSLLDDEAHYRQVSCASREAALAFTQQLGIDRYSAYFRQVIEKKSAINPAGQSAPSGKNIRDLTPAQRALLLKKMGVRKRLRQAKKKQDGVSS